MQSDAGERELERRSRRRRRVFLFVLLLWLVLPWCIPIRPMAFNAGRWRQFHHYYTGGQGWSLPPVDDLTRLRMVDDLATRPLRIGMPYSEARDLLGARKARPMKGSATT